MPKTLLLYGLACLISFSNSSGARGASCTQALNTVSRPQESQLKGPANQEEEITITMVLNRLDGDPTIRHIGEGPIPYKNLDHYGETYGADHEDMKLAEDFAQKHGLEIVHKHHASRRIMLKGSVSKVQQAFSVRLDDYYLPSKNLTYRSYDGSVHLPEALSKKVIAVLGLDTQPVAKPHFRIHKTIEARQGYKPADLVSMYDFPKGLDGSGQTIALIELGGGYSESDLAGYFKIVGVKMPKVKSISVNGAQNSPGQDADGEVMLDIEVAGGLAPGANINVYFAPNTDQGFINAISEAVHHDPDGAKIISVSWGGPETTWHKGVREAMHKVLEDAAANGITVTVAAGDDGFTDGVKGTKSIADFPASSPYCLSCGGTSAVIKNGTIKSEVVWNDGARGGATGGGVSRYFKKPGWQQSANIPKQPDTGFEGRGIPDAAGDADPLKGYFVVVDGQAGVVGGTSAVAPLWAALIARINQALGRPVGFINPPIYQHFNDLLRNHALNDIVTGNNGKFSAAKGWDPCTGCGTPRGSALLTFFKGLVK